MGYAYAQLKMGYCYSNGEGVEKDMVEAYAYYNLASVSDMFAGGHRDALEKQMQPDAALRGQQRTKELQKEIEAKIAAKASGK